MLWNQSGDAEQALAVEYKGNAIPTPLADDCPNLILLMKEVFNLKYLKMARIFYIGPNGLLIPHKDSLEHSNPIKRLHIPIQTDENSFSSEDEFLYQMKKGEIWSVDVTSVHSAACFSHQPRLHLVMDFDSAIPTSELFNNDHNYKTNLSPTFIQRPKLSTQDVEQLHNLSTIMNKHNFYDIVSILAKVHFFKSCHAGDMFDWLLTMTERTGEEQLINETKALKSGCIIARDTGNLKLTLIK